MFRRKITIEERIESNNEGVNGEQIGSQIPLETLEKLRDMGKNAEGLLPKGHPFYEDLHGDLPEFDGDLGGLIRKRKEG